ncbi:MAG TPA: sigma-54 dependent transcriptional regulator [Chitinophagaceae bacterium]|nr:sigma-54 dependent transcriptional regulator [Chitinophagaceae bacterium]
MNNVLIIDDEEKLRSLLSRIIRLEGFEILEADSGKAALKKLQQKDIDVVLCDVKLPDSNGIELAKTIKENYPLVEIILLTAYGDIADGVQAMKNGAFDYIVKGDDNGRIIPLLHRAVEKVALVKRVQQLENRTGKKYSFESITGRSKPIQAAVELAQKVAVTQTPVLLLGETGTGKEVFAQAIHQASSRHKQSFVAINCSAFSKELLESELFGHVAGAFTGAIKDKKGLFEEAHKGTIFLDEIGEMAIDLQAKLLRVLESGEFIKVGESKPSTVDVRIIAATNRELNTEIKAGHFREDLYYRLSVFQIKLPSLKERSGDIEALAKYFASLYAVKVINKKSIDLSPDFVSALQHYNWPGNIRELKNVIERAVILSNGNELTTAELPLELQAFSSGLPTELSAFSLASAEKLHIQKVLNYTNGNKTETARLLNIGLTTLYRKIEEYKIG